MTLCSVMELALTCPGSFQLLAQWLNLGRQSVQNVLHFKGNRPNYSATDFKGIVVRPLLNMFFMLILVFSAFMILSMRTFITW